jgi:hypothetical protein
LLKEYTSVAAGQILSAPFKSLPVKYTVGGWLNQSSSSFN